MADHACEFCGAPVVWTAEQRAIDAFLRRRGSGLGVLCDPCDDREIAIAIKDERRHRKAEAQALRRANHG